MAKVKLGKYLQEYSVKNKKNEKFPVYSVTNVNGFCKDYFNKDVSSENKTTYKIVPFGYFAYNPSRINVGSIACQEKEKNVIVSPLYTVFNCSQDLNRKYLMYFFKSEHGMRLINSSVSGSVRFNLKFKTLCEFEIIERSIEEQEEAVKIFDNILELIRNCDEQLKCLDELVKSQFIEMFGDPKTNSFGLPTQRFDTISENLDYRRRPITAKDRKEGIYPYYGASGIVDYVEDYIFDEDILLISEDGANLVMRSTPIAFSVSGKVWVNNHAHVVKFENFATQKYIEYYFEQIDLDEYITGSAQPKFNQAKLNGMLIPIPTIELQNKFADFVQQIDKSKYIVQQRKIKYQELLNKKMDEYFK